MAQFPGNRPPHDPWSKVRFSHDSEQLRKGGPGAAILVLFFGAVVGAIVGGFVGLFAIRYVDIDEYTEGFDGEVAGMETWVVALLLFTAIGAALGLGFAVYSLVQERLTRGPSERDPQ